MTDTLAHKEKRLRQILSQMDSCLVAFSGGVDSAYLAVVATEELGSRALAITAQSPSYPTYQKQIALDVVERFRIRHEFIRSNELDDPNYAGNPLNRCYFCKHELYTEMGVLAGRRGFRFIVDGNNLDDTGDYRPGRAAGEELSVRSPLIEAELGKAEIRELSRLLGLPTWDQPASACLSSRIPYGSQVTKEKLTMIDRGEAVLRSLGFRQARVRHHGDVARVEIAREEMGRALTLDMFEQLSTELKAIGFRFVAIDVDGYRTGALNETIDTTDTTDRTDTTDTTDTPGSVRFEHDAERVGNSQVSAK
jgi:uncharacterized protein